MGLIASGAIGGNLLASGAVASGVIASVAIGRFHLASGAVGSGTINAVAAQPDLAAFTGGWLVS